MDKAEEEANELMPCNRQCRVYTELWSKGIHQYGCQGVRRSQVAAALRQRDAKIDKLEAELDRYRDAEADRKHEILSHFDAAAAAHTDLFTWIKCKLAEIKRLRDANAKQAQEIEELKMDVDDAYYRGREEGVKP